MQLSSSSSVMQSGVMWNNRVEYSRPGCACGVRRLWLGLMCVIAPCDCGSLHCRLRSCAVVLGRTETALGLAGCHGTIDRLLGYPIAWRAHEVHSWTYRTSSFNPPCAGSLLARVEGHRGLPWRFKLAREKNTYAEASHLRHGTRLFYELLSCGEPFTRMGRGGWPAMRSCHQ